MDMFKVASFNVNGFASAEQNGFWNWFDVQDIDVLCLQETKGRSNSKIQFPESWHYECWNSKENGYSGVGIVSRLPFVVCYPSIDSPDVDIQGRIFGADFDGIQVWSIYAPTTIHSDSSFRRRFWEYLVVLTEEWVQKPTIICGDLNMYFSERDIHPSLFTTRKKQLLQDQIWIQQLRKQGWMDSWRSLYSTKREYSFYSHRNPNMLQQNKGIRLDYQLVSPHLKDCIQQVKIDKNVLNLSNISDHAPVIAYYDFIL
jgi:exodeoxyribonuclease III